MNGEVKFCEIQKKKIRGVGSGGLGRACQVDMNGEVKFL